MVRLLAGILSIGALRSVASWLRCAWLRYGARGESACATARARMRVLDM